MDEVFTESESEDDLLLSRVTKNLLTEAPKENYAKARPSGQQKSCYKPGDYVPVRFRIKNAEYRYVSVINKIDEEENDLRFTFLKICNEKVQTFIIDESGISDVSFDQIINKVEQS